MKKKRSKKKDDSFPFPILFGFLIGLWINRVFIHVPDHSQFTITNCAILGDPDVQNVLVHKSGDNGDGWRLPMELRKGGPRNIYGCSQNITITSKRDKRFLTTMMFGSITTTTTVGHVGTGYFDPHMNLAHDFSLEKSAITYDYRWGQFKPKEWHYKTICGLTHESREHSVWDFVGKTLKKKGMASRDVLADYYNAPYSGYRILLAHKNIEPFRFYFTNPTTTATCFVIRWAIKDKPLSRSQRYRP